MVNKPRFLFINLARIGRQVGQNDYARNQKDVVIGGDVQIPVGITQEVANYRLVSAITHQGATHNRGHFMANLLINENWWTLSDAMPMFKTRHNEPRKACYFVYQCINF